MESLLTKEELLAAVKGRQLGSADCLFNDVQTDSRNVSADKPCMFVPLMGEFQNGHKYIEDVLAKKASVILINESEYESKTEHYNQLAEKYAGVCFLLVENTLYALQDAAEAYVTKKCGNMIRVSITGSSGKTTTKEMMVSVAKAHFGTEAVAYTYGNLNSETGLPLSVFKIRGDEKIGIFEMGMNRVNEIGEISKVLKSRYGIITNIGTAHIGILGSQENIACEKRKSFAYIPENGAAVVGADDPFADFCTEGVRGKVVKFGRNVPAEISGVCFVEDKGLFGTDFELDGLSVHLPLSGSYNYLNALSVIACAKQIGIPSSDIKKGLESVASLAGRMEVKECKLTNGKKVVLIKDCYNANLDSMMKVIDFCGQLKNVGKKIFVLADMKELGAESAKSHEAIGRCICEVGPELVYLVGPEMKAAEKFAEAKDNISVKWFEESNDKNFEAIAADINLQADENDVILLKGSHSMQLEKLVPLLCGSEGEAC
ncbi:UDP-N-acetylmuramoyl-tripeptide--D-alanyl-D-alanine ligase [Treponema bryantii]|uniref:UDP-N-acetylmuramoyl-tripeptide--D-alanyl-D- alanine ligase n=1 Tax=Treponema bryantii TaxID=163 RepID=UPI0003B50E37|nr:UDP-N-acetylmuramoyl-tripeptide--D-alanyl-D-alanine ligase [Treponema bryantii]